MKKNLLTILFYFATFLALGQNTINVKGKVVEKKSLIPIESATIYLKSVKDSTVIDYTISDKNGNFALATKKINTPVYFKVAFTSYADFSEKLENLQENKDFGIIKLDDDVNTLSELVIKAEAPPITIKNDTLEFNASSFKVRPDANVEALLKQLPGVEIDEEGKITVNGKEVNNILVKRKTIFW